MKMNFAKFEVLAPVLLSLLGCDTVLLDEWLPAA
jgi:hypothetical protein